MPRWPEKSKEAPVETAPEEVVKEPVKPQWQTEHPEWKWDRMCTVCGGKTMMESPDQYDIEIFECQNKQCRAQFTIKTFYDSKGKFVAEEFLGKTMEALNG